MARILCALSGGVDSTVAARLLAEEGHEVVGVFLSSGVVASGERSCCSARDARDAASIAEKLGIPFYSQDYSPEFGGLIEHFLAEYRRGRTPSPCVLCNQDLKFGRLFDLAEGIGAEAVATGHYALLEEGAIRRPRDRSKDQTYFLFGIPRARLPRIRFPLGGRTKAEVRAIAREAGLITAEKPESMEICFVPTNDYRDLLRERGGLTPGFFVDPAGRRRGSHQGYEAFTVGQRKGLPALGEPRFVLEIRPETAEVVIGPRGALAVEEMEVWRVRWLEDPPTEGFEALVQIRARHEAAPARLEPAGEGRVRVRFAQKQEGVAPGQAGVFYRGDRLLGGGWIQGPVRRTDS